MDQANTPLLSPREAARVIGCSRSAIMRALASRSLPATRGNANNWLIRREDLDRWFDERSGSGSEVVQDPGPDMVRPMLEPDQETVKRLAAAEARAELLEIQLMKLEAERDKLLGMVERLSEPKPGFIERLVRAFRQGPSSLVSDNVRTPVGNQ